VKPLRRAGNETLDTVEQTPEGTKRRYSSALRAEQAQLTRRRVVTAAHMLFLGRGYAGATVEAVATDAGVSPQTVYNAVGGKASLLAAVYAELLAGAAGEASARFDAPDAEALLAEYAGVARRLGERTTPVLAVAQAAASDRDVRAFLDTVELERSVGTHQVAAEVAVRFGLRSGLTVAAAADIVWTLTSAEVADRLVSQRGWGWDRFEAWLATTLADTLL
jgi:AcrR family transcriptional regulator